MVELIERINCLLKQDRTVYKRLDYLDPSHQQDLESSSPVPIEASCRSVSSSSTSSSNRITEAWREKICEWSYQVVDHFEFSREVVSVSISLLDRYLANKAVDKKQFQLAAMSCLYLCIKICEPGTLSMACMVDLSQGYFSAAQMTAMEMSILQTLSWHVHPPTPVCFASHLLHILPASTCPTSVKHDLQELARFLTELSVIDYFFVNKHASSIALAALLNAMENLHGFPIFVMAQFREQLALLDQLDPESVEVNECRSRLTELYVQGGYAAPSPTSVARPALSEQEQPRVDTVSPVCVASAVDVAQNPDFAGMPPNPPIDDTKYSVPRFDRDGQYVAATYSMAMPAAVL